MASIAGTQGQRAAAALEAMHPHLVVKSRQAELGIYFQSKRALRGSSPLGKTLEAIEDDGACYRRMLDLNRRRKPIREAV